MHEAGAAVVAAQLLAFYKEPVRYRPRLTHGREAFAGGLLVFRFAHGKFSHALMRDLTVGERGRLREAAVFFIRQVCLWEGASHYQLLCLPRDARREAIKENYHGLIALLHPDRQDAASGHWPPGCAQRVNQAYAVLSDEGQRAQYDAGLHTTAGASVLDDSVRQAPLTAAARSPILGRGTVALIRMRKPALLLAAGVASLFFAQIWWFGDVPREYMTLSSAAPFDLSSRWMRDVHSGSERPRFMGSSESPRTPQAGREAGTEAVIPFLTPLWRALSSRVSESRSVPRTGDEPRGAAPPTPAERVEVPAPRVAQAQPRAEAPMVRGEAPPRPEVPVARFDDALPRGDSPVIAQAAPGAASAAPDSQLSTLDMEMLVARVVTYYEVGDLDRLLGLYDVGSLGFFEAVRIRHDFQEFFRTTRARRLRLNRVSWETAAQSARAKGMAALSAEYSEQPGGRMERNVELELDVVVRDGQPRIARLSLFPHTR